MSGGEARAADGAADRVAEIRAAEDAFTAAVVAHDTVALKRIIAPEFALVGRRSTGDSVVRPDEWFASLTQMRISAFDLQAIDIRIIGDTAIATMDGGWTLDLAGRPIDERVLLTDVWIRRGGRWQIVHRHSAPYPR